MHRIVAITLIASACSSGPDDPGSGTNTLFVIARGVVFDDFTDFTVEITARGIPVTDARVQLKDDDRGSQTDAVSMTPGVYLGRLPGAVEVLRLDIEAGDDELNGGIGGPEGFEITRPSEGALVLKGSSDQLLVEWTRPEDEDIDEVRLSIVADNDLPVTMVDLPDDPGQGRVPLPALTGGSEMFSAVVRRRDVVRLEGGTDGSLLSLERSARVGFELAP